MYGFNEVLKLDCTDCNWIGGNSKICFIFSTPDLYNCTRVIDTLTYLFDLSLFTEINWKGKVNM